MKKILLLALLAAGVQVFAQSKKNDTTYAFTANWRREFKTLSFPFHLDDVYEIKPNSTKMLNCNILKVFYYSSTIYDASQIILVDSSRFFCYFIGCMEQLYSAGYYKKDATVINFKSDRKVAGKFAKLMSIYISSRMKYSDLSDTTFIIGDNKLSKVSE